MSVSTEQPCTALPTGEQSPQYRWPGFLVAALLSAMALYWNFQVGSTQPASLATDQPYAVPLDDGRGQVDVFLSPDVPVTLIVSNLGAATQSSVLELTAEPLRDAPRFRPLPITRRHTRPLDDARPPLGLAASPRVNSPQPSSPPPAHRDFWLHVTSQPLEDPRGYQQIHARLAATGAAVQVYLDASLLKSDEIPSPLAATANDIVSRLEQQVLPVIHRQIGPITDIDHDGRLTVLLTPWLGRLRGGETQVRGFVRSSDFRGEVAFPFSNHADVLYLNSDLPTHSALQTLLTHEIVHAALFSVPQKQRPAKFEWNDWLNEGLAHLLERSAGGDWSNVDYRVARYGQDTAAAPLVVADYYRSGRWRDHGCRGATFLFWDWCAQQYSSEGQTDLIPALLASQRPDSTAITKALGTDFAELYRDWTISLVLNTHSTEQASRVGRFGNSGPRASQLMADEDQHASWNICGTATQFVEFRATRAGWYRVSLAGDAQQPWQATLLSGPPSPNPTLMAHRNGTTNSTELTISGWDRLTAEWHVDSVYCEQLEGLQPRAWHWSGEEVYRGARTGGKLILPIALDGQQSAVVKVRLKHTSGRVKWAWCDLPGNETPDNSRVTQMPGRVAY